jgi:hypothetical protein
MKQREIFVRVEWSQQLVVWGLYLVQSRFAQGFFGLPPLAAAGVAGAARLIESATSAAQAIVLSAARRSAAVRVECIDVHLRVRRAVHDANAPARHRSFPW